MGVRRAVLIALLTTLSAPAFAAGPSALKKHVRALTSPELRGRASGTAGADIARRYVKREFKRVGLEAAGAKGWEVSTDVVVDIDVSATFRVGEHVLAHGVEFAATGFSDSGVYSGETVFVGHGLSTPELGYDDYEGVSVRGKIVVALTGAPSQLRDAMKDRDWMLTAESRAAVALAKGAVGLILVNDASTYGDADTQRSDDLPNVKPTFPLSGMMVVRMTNRIAASVFGPTVASWTPRAARPEMTELSLELQLDRDYEDAASLVGRVPGTEGPPLVIVAHFDGLGDQPDGNVDLSYEGADDNASGVAVLVEVARALVRRPPPGRTVFIVATDAEERGLRGSRRVARYLAESYGTGEVINMDMVGRLRDNIVFVETDDATWQEIETTRSDVDLNRLPAGSSFSDHIAFGEVGFSRIHLTTGRHADYHRVTDSIDHLNFIGMQRVTGFVVTLITDRSRR